MIELHSPEEQELLNIFSSAKTEEELQSLFNKHLSSIDGDTVAFSNGLEISGMPITELMGYFGGKSKIGPTLIQPVMMRAMTTYVEAFGGMFWNYFKLDLGKFLDLKTIVYNDFNPLNANFMKCATDPIRLLKYIYNRESKGEYSRDKELFLKYRDEVNKIDLKKLARNLAEGKASYLYAYKYAYVLSHSFNGIPASGLAGFSNKKAGLASLTNKLEKPKWISMLQRITHVRCQDFADVIKEFDSPTTNHYDDPPYNKKEHYYGQFFGPADHKRLAKVLKNVKGCFQLSYYDFPELEALYPKSKYNWQRRDFVAPSSSQAGKVMSKRTEVVIYSTFRNHNISKLSKSGII